jgi:mono/diheme cytochrome c family protein
VALAHHEAGSLETAYGNSVVSTLARFNAGGVGANPTTATAQTLEQARGSYTGSCSQCHGTSGNTQGAFGQTSFAPATDLSSQSTRNLSDSQMFYIIKNGLGFTPMPAFKDQYSDTEIWNIVNFIRMLQTTSPDQQTRLTVPTPRLTSARPPDWMPPRAMPRAVRRCLPPLAARRVISRVAA